MDEIIKKIATAKGITAILIIVLVAIFVWRNLDFLTEISFTIKSSGSKEEVRDNGSRPSGSGVAKLSLGEITLSPSPKTLPSFAVFEIKNTGSIITKNVRVVIDFGPVKSIAYEVIGPKMEDVSGSEPNQSVLNIDIAQMRPSESAYVYVQTSDPSFKRIALSGGNTIGVTEYTYQDFLESKKDTYNTGFMSFLFILLGAFLVVMGIYFTLALIQKLNRWFHIEW